MRLFAFLALLILSVSPSSPAAPNDLRIEVVDGLVSIHAEAVPLGRLLELLDRVAGTESTVPAELSNRNVSLQFQELALDRAIHKIFEGLTLDYAVLGEKEIRVTSLSQRVNGTPSAAQLPVTATRTPVQAVPSGVPVQNPPVNPFQLGNAQGVGNPGVAAGPGNAPVEPAVIQTPFGPVPNPRAAQSSGNPGAASGPGFPFGPAGGGAFSATPGISFGGMSPGSPGTQTNPNEPSNSQPSIFGNTRPSMLELNNPQPDGPDPAQP